MPHISNAALLSAIVASKTKNQINDDLARMILAFVEAYSLRKNWRRYSYLSEMKGDAIMNLCGALLKFDERKSTNAFAYAWTCVDNMFKRRLAIEKRHGYALDELRIQCGLLPSTSRQLDEIELSHGLRKLPHRSAKQIALLFDDISEWRKTLSYAKIVVKLANEHGLYITSRYLIGKMSDLRQQRKARS